MREILFRGFHECENGKQKVFVNGEWHKGEWVFGYPLIDNAKCSLKAKGGKCQCKHDGTDAWILSWEDDFHEYTEYEIIPSTVGQYTGLLDKNGQKIFEGDILAVQQNYTGTLLEIIEYEDGGFVRNIGERKKPYLESGCRSEVIGNIHDNPE